MEKRGEHQQRAAYAAGALRGLASLLLDACSVREGRVRDSTAEGAAGESTARAHGEVDWARLLDISRFHSVTPLVARRLAEPSGVEGAPGAVLAAVRAHCDANALRNVMLARQLTEILGELAARGVEAMPIKGPALAVSAYGDLALREFGDLDIVVRQSSFDRARELLGQWGYRSQGALTGAGERALRRSDHHIALVHEATKVKVELHWSLDNGRPGRILDGDWVWRNARTVSLLGRELPALSSAASLVYLCVHGAKHGFVKLGWIRDIAGVLAVSPKGDLEGVAELAAAADARRRLALGVRLACGLLGAPVRSDLVVREERETASLEREVIEGLFSGEEPPTVRQMAFQSATLDRGRDQVGYWFHVLAAPHVVDVELLPLPRWLRWGYYILRPARLVASRVGARLPWGARAARPPRSGERAAPGEVPPSNEIHETEGRAAMRNT